MNVDRFGFVRHSSPITVALLVVIGAVMAAGAISLVGIVVGALQ